MRQIQLGVAYVSAADQAALGQEARQYYNAKVRANQPATRAFDLQMDSLFESIIAGREDIDAKIRSLHQVWKNENLWDKLKDTIKIDHLHQYMYHWAKSQDRKLKTASSQQMVTNWNRMRLITSPEPEYSVPQTWVGPAVAPSVEVRTLYSEAL